MAYQSIPLLAAWWEDIGTARVWNPEGDEPLIIASLVDAGESDRFLAIFGVLDNNRVNLNISDGVQQTLDDLTDSFEASGGLRLTIGSNSWIFLLAGADMSDPYLWFPSNAADVAAAYAAASSAVAATLEISDDPDTDFARLRVGSTGVRKAYVGATEATRVYVGSTRVL